MRENRCIVCEELIPEGRIICPACEQGEGINMLETLIKLDTPIKVSEFVQLCSKCPGDIDVCSGRYIVSGKSLLGLYSLDLTKPLKMEFHGDIPYEVREGMKKFIMN